MELICISHQYDSKTLEVFAKYSISFPKENDIVELLRVVNYPRIGKKGLIVSGFDGQFIPGDIMGIKGEVEVSFDSKRFTTLLGESLTTEMLKEFKEESNNIYEKVEKLSKKQVLKDLRNGKNN